MEAFRFPVIVAAAVCLLATVTAAADDVFDGVLDNTVPCHQSCELTYSLHTYPQEDELYACQRGCRLFSICEFVGEDEELNQTKSECDSACREAYLQSDEQYACSLGCQNQLPFAVQRQQQLLSMMPRIHLLYPLTFEEGFWNDIMNSAQSFITSSWSFYLQADDGKVVIFQSGPRFDFLKDEDVKEEPKASYPVFKDYHHNVMQERDKDLIVDRSDPKDVYGQVNLYLSHIRNSWIPDWFLSIALVMSVLVLLWICCSAVDAAVEQYVPAEKLSIYGDLEYANEQKLSMYPPSSLVIIRSAAGEEEDEAGPLPSKVCLDKSDV